MGKNITELKALRSRLAATFAISGLCFFIHISSAHAMPMFARKYKMECAMCHAAVPRLNFTGYKFKAAGYRMPWEIGKDQNDSTLNLENYTAFVALINAPLQVQVDHGANQTTTSFYTNANEIDLHAITGSFGKNWGSGFEVDALSSGSVNLNQAFLTFTQGSTNSFGTIQVGVVPNFLGYGQLDRSAATSVPLLLSQSAGNSSFDTLFNWSGPRAAGITASYWVADTLFSASVRDRLLAGPSGLDSLGTTRSHMGDVLLTATHFYDQVGAGSALAAFYYKGLSQVPSTLGGASLFGNSFNHIGLSANKYFSDPVNVFVGGAWNLDQRFDPVIGISNQTLQSFGSFGGAEYFWSPQAMTGLRLDQFRTDSTTPDAQVLGGSVYANWHVINWIVLSAEYQYLHYGTNTVTGAGINSASGSVDEHILNLQALVTY